ncbi:MAG: cell division protein SepF [Lachnospiraceae bacterium]|nr:cell division protein SepF [Lachnospiraceae bacterium]
MKLYDDDEEYDDEYEMEEEEPTPRRTRRSKASTESIDEEKPAAAVSPRRTAEPAEKERPARIRRSSNVVPMKSHGSMEVCMVKPAALEDAREVCDILLSGRAVVINMEGVHVDLAQRSIDFTSGACYSINGNLQKISKYIFIVSPQSIGLTGDFQDTLEGAQDLSTLSLNL